MSNTAEQTGSLLFNLAPYTKIPYEDIATLALCSIVKESPVLRDAFTKILCEHLDIPMIEDVCQYKTQVTGKKLERPDIVGFNNVGEEVLICEAKFYAGLTGNQPDAYLERLRKDNGKGLVFLCPAKRIVGLWKRLSKREDAVRITDDCILIHNVRMGIVSWEELLDNLRSVSGHNGGVMQADLTELQVFCEKIIKEDTFIPFSEQDLSADVAISIERYYKVMDKLRDVLLSKDEYGITQHINGRSNLQSTPQMGGDYYIYLKAKECMPCIYYEKYAWRQHDSIYTPFWLALLNLKEQQDAAVITYINSLPKEMIQKSGKKGISLIALETPVGLECTDTVQELCSQVLGHIDGYKECLGKIAIEG